MPKTILGIGAHYDDCVFGIPGVLMQAIRKNHRVVILSLIGDYSNWRPMKEREKELTDGTVRLCAEFGVEMRFLKFAEMSFDVEVETKNRWLRLLQRFNRMLRSCFGHTIVTQIMKWHRSFQASH